MNMLQDYAMRAVQRADLLFAAHHRYTSDESPSLPGILSPLHSGVPSAYLEVFKYSSVTEE